MTITTIIAGFARHTKTTVLADFGGHHDQQLETTMPQKVQVASNSEGRMLYISHIIFTEALTDHSLTYVL